DAVDALSHLAKMSGTGSAFGQADYVAISAIAIISLVLALISLGALAFPVLGAVAVFAIILAAIAIYKIRHSNGTQTGVVPALIGIVFSVVAIGGTVVRQVMDWSRTREQT